MPASSPANHCIRCCEEVRELAVPLTHGTYYEVRPAGLDGTGEISLRDLVKFVLAKFWLWHPCRSHSSARAGIMRAHDRFLRVTAAA